MRGEFQIIFTIKHRLKEIPTTANCPKNLHVKNEVILWPLTSSKIIVLVAQPISTDCGPPAWAVDKRAELSWPSSRGKRWPAVDVVLRYPKCPSSSKKKSAATINLGFRGRRRRWDSVLHDIKKVFFRAWCILIGCILVMGRQNLSA